MYEIFIGFCSFCVEKEDKNLLKFCNETKLEIWIILLQGVQIKKVIV